MALDIYLQNGTSLPKSGENRFLSLKDDGYFWFLYSFFEEISKKTGQTIETYEDAFFKDKDLDLFDQMIKQVREEILQKPHIWEEFIGTTFERGVRTKVEKKYSTVYKKELEAILIKLENAVSEAKERNIGILFFGD